MHISYNMSLGRSAIQAQTTDSELQVGSIDAHVCRSSEAQGTGLVGVRLLEQRCVVASEQRGLDRHLHAGLPYDSVHVTCGAALEAFEDRVARRRGG